MIERGHPLLGLAALCRDGWRGETQEGAHFSAWAALAARHRVDGLVAAATGDRQRVEATMAQSLAQLAECDRLNHALAPLAPVFLKGPAVAALGYANPLLKLSADIDILVRPDQLDRSADRLTALGYGRLLPRAEIPLSRWHAVSNQSVWVCGAHRVELHHRAIAVHHPFDSARHMLQSVPIAAGLALPTFGDAEQFAYLALHGALSCWFRLKWLADFAAFCERRPLSIGAFVAHSRTVNAQEAAAEALVLSHQLFGLEWDDEINGWLVSQRHAHASAMRALTMLRARARRPRVSVERGRFMSRRCAIRGVWRG